MLSSHKPGNAVLVIRWAPRDQLVLPYERVFFFLWRQRKKQRKPPPQSLPFGCPKQHLKRRSLLRSSLPPFKIPLWQIWKGDKKAFLPSLAGCRNKCSKSGKATESRPFLNMQEREPLGQAGFGVPFFRSFLGTQERTKRKLSITSQRYSSLYIQSSTPRQGGFLAP